ncbi:HAD-IA family hydrolase [Litorivicinus sp.]|nr:HAD-IA family hydrolase [Litorivicinus sp.]MDC1208685.1 HAD-IA family hydrolase [Litorivicinus sp.]MDC1239759.1 HAD-IA family hydrolase [Litorivicinus sp.]MDC1466222.1 HAD-IA family hydrolase [Litorivicinus sp.]
MQAYLFDFDGTLVDSAPDLVGALDAALNRAGLSGVGLEAGKQMVGNGSGTLVERALRAATADPTIKIDSAFGKLMLSVFLESYELTCTDASVLYPGAIEALQGLKLRGKQLGLVTNKPRKFVDLMLPALGIETFFDSIVAGDDLLTKKPEPEMVLKALAELNVDSKDACLIGDSRADLGAAKRAGIFSILVSFGYHGNLDIAEAGAGRIIGRLTDLLNDDA